MSSRMILLNKAVNGLRRGLSTKIPKETGTTLSFASPESDFTASNPDSSTSSTTLVDNLTSSPNFSFSSPESDFTSAPINPTITGTQYSSFDTPDTIISFSSPESDFTSSSSAVGDGRTPKELAERFFAGGAATQETEKDRDLSFASPESDFTGRAARLNADVPELFEAFKSDLLNSLTPAAKGDMAYSLSQSSDSGRPPLTPDQEAMLSATPDLSNTRVVSVSEAFSASPEARVITAVDPPFKIKSVNDAWVGLCGFTAEESLGKTLGLLQGEKTDEGALMQLERDVLRGRGRPEATLVNYSKDGREFLNKLEVSYVKDEMTEEIVGLLGVLREQKTAAA
mmetsp:Transcript_18526/g.37851  ORF Transcript_18526/g.37851 Transcript_18526/m.37851 type:complete len:341 (+) Transcript_18526:64-1086(+)